MKCGKCGIKDIPRWNKVIWRNPWGKQELKCYCMTCLLEIANFDLDAFFGGNPHNRYGLHWMDYNRIIHGVNGKQIDFNLVAQAAIYAFPD